MWRLFIILLLLFTVNCCAPNRNLTKPVKKEFRVSQKKINKKNRLYHKSTLKNKIDIHRTNKRLSNEYRHYRNKHRIQVELNKIKYKR